MVLQYAKKKNVKLETKRTRSILLLELMIFYWALYCNCSRLVVIITICLFMTGMSLLAGKMIICRNSIDN